MCFLYGIVSSSHDDILVMTVPFSVLAVASEREEEFLDCGLSCKDLPGVKESLQSFVDGEMLTGSNQFFCETCNCKMDARRVACFRKLPPILTFNLLRFDYDLERVCSFFILHAMRWACLYPCGLVFSCILCPHTMLFLIPSLVVELLYFWCLLSRIFS